MSKEWLEQLSALLKSLGQIDFGYPLGDNYVRPAPVERNVTAQLLSHGISCSQLLQIYDLCDGMSLPDIHNGYFVKSLDDLVNDHLAREPVTISGLFEGGIIVFGSSGGGDRFALRSDDGCVLKLGGGLVKDRVFYANPNVVQPIASCICTFLSKLVDDVRAFVHGERDHAYMA